MNLSINIQGFLVSTELNLNNDQQHVKVAIYSQNPLNKTMEFVAPFITTLTLNGVYYETTEIQNSSVILTFKKACDSSELIDIFKKLEEEFS